MNYSVIILAAGSGTRMNLGYNKMLLQIKKTPLITLSIKTFLKDINCTEVIIVVNELEKVEIKSILEQYNLWNNKCKITVGGTERQYSVYNGLKEVTNNIVLVHDGARPFITQTLIDELINEVISCGCAVPGVKVKDTIKFVNEFIIEKTLPRDNLYAVQTPQVCLTKVIKDVHKQAKKDNYLSTDEASLIEKYTNIKIRIIPSSYENIKITTQEDIIYAEKLYDKYYNVKEG